MMIASETTAPLHVCITGDVRTTTHRTTVTAVTASHDGTSCVAALVPRYQVLALREAATTLRQSRLQLTQVRVVLRLHQRLPRLEHTTVLRDATKKQALLHDRLAELVPQPRRLHQRDGCLLRPQLGVQGLGVVSGHRSEAAE
jgi:hypothetical protein